MAALQEPGSKLRAPKQAGGLNAAMRKPARSLMYDFDDSEGDAASGSAGGVLREKKGSSAPAAASPLLGVTVEDAELLDCGVCCLPLKRPIFQCDVGHMICSLCHDKLKSVGECHKCRATGSYRRCHGMEDLVESIRVPCPHTAYGCAMRLSYYDQESHGLVCPHAPCHCPSEGCRFVGSTAALLGHFFGTHKWPCKSARLGVFSFSVCLQDGFNFVVSSTTDEHGRKYLFLLNVVRLSLCRTMSVICNRPHSAAAKEMRFVLSYPARSNATNKLVKHEQKAEYVEVPCSDLSGGLPDLRGSYQFIVSNHAGGEDNEHDMKVMVDIIIDNSSDQ